jgi:hypothetical protein
MKKTRLAIMSMVALMATYSLSIAQLAVDPETKKFQYQETVTLDSLDKNQIYERAVDYMTNQFKTNKFDVNDKTNMKLGHEGNFPVSYKYDFKYTSNNTVTYQITLNVKDGKYRYTITDFKIYDDKLGPKTAQPLELSYQKMKTDTKKEFSNKFTTEINKLIADLKLKMSAQKKEDKEDW